MKGILKILLLMLFSTSLVCAQDEIYTIVEQMPVYGNCPKENVNEQVISYHKEEKYCSLKNIEAYLNAELFKLKSKYPNVFLNAKVQFVVELDGSLSDTKVIISSGSETFDEDVLKIILGMQNWQAGKQRGIPVRVQYTLPVILKRN